MLFHSSSSQFQVLTTHSFVLPVVLQRNTLVDVVGTCKDEEGMHIAAYDCSVSTDDALCYAPYFMFDSLHALLLNRNLC